MKQNMDGMQPSARLSDLTPGQSAYIKHIDETSAIGRRMGDLGFRPGVSIRCERQSFLGDPMAYRVDQTGTVVAIRRMDARAVAVRKDGQTPWG